MLSSSTSTTLSNEEKGEALFRQAITLAEEDNLDTAAQLWIQAANLGYPPSKLIQCCSMLPGHITTHTDLWREPQWMTKAFGIKIPTRDESLTAAKNCLILLADVDNTQLLSTNLARRIGQDARILILIDALSNEPCLGLSDQKLFTVLSRVVNFHRTQASFVTRGSGEWSMFTDSSEHHLIVEKMASYLTNKLNYSNQNISMLYQLAILLQTTFAKELVSDDITWSIRALSFIFSMQPDYQYTAYHLVDGLLQTKRYDEAYKKYEEIKAIEENPQKIKSKLLLENYLSITTALKRIVVRDDEDVPFKYIKNNPLINFLDCKLSVSNKQAIMEIITNKKHQLSGLFIKGDYHSPPEVSDLIKALDLKNNTVLRSLSLFYCKFDITDLAGNSHLTTLNLLAGSALNFDSSQELVIVNNHSSLSSFLYASLTKNQENSDITKILKARKVASFNWTRVCLVFAFMRANQAHTFQDSILALLPFIMNLIDAYDTATPLPSIKIDKFINSRFFRQVLEVPAKQIAEETSNKRKLGLL